MSSLLQSIEDSAEITETFCGEGSMIWRRWGSGRKLFLLHGGFGSWRHWVHNIQPLAEHFEVIAADMPGQGDSDMPPQPYTPDSLSEIVAYGMKQILDRGEACDLGAFSFGSIIGGGAAAKLGQVVENFVVVGATGFGRRGRQTEDMIRVLPDMSEEEKRETHRHNLGILMFSDPSLIDEMALEIQVTNTRKNRIRSRPFSLADPLIQLLPEIDARITAIWGSEDVTSKGFFDDRVEHIRAVQPNAEIVMLDGVGHWTQYEAPDRVNEIFLSIK